ncbi:hypothetical protein ACFL6S_06060 [Candidatus Poribacteria bacterium]
MGPNAVYISLGFLVIQVAILSVVLRSNRRSREKDAGKKAPKQEQGTKLNCLKESDILSLEYEYARTTAAEAMRDRHTMMNYYLLVVGIVSAGVTGILKLEHGPKSIGTVLLWILCCVGWFYFLKIIRLREAWHDSALAICKIRDFYIEHTGNCLLGSAFRWRTYTLPPPDKPWTLYFLSAMLIGFLNSVAYVVGGVLILADIAQLGSKWALLAITMMAILGLALFETHRRLYFAFLRPIKRPVNSSNSASKETSENETND